MIQPIGFFKVWRSLYSKPIWLKSTLEQQVILLTLISMANFKENEWEWKGQKYTVKAGQFITSTESIISNTGGNVSPQNVKTALKRFEKLGFLTNESTKEGRLITIANWVNYQGEECQPNQVTNRGVTKGSPRGNQGVTTIEEGNKDNNTNKDKEKTYSPAEAEPTPKKRKPSYMREGTIQYGEFENVYIKESEKEKLVNEYGLSVINEQIESLSNYIENNNKGKKYKNHYAALRTWCNKLPKKKAVVGLNKEEENKYKEESDQYAKNMIKQYGDDWQQKINEELDINF